MRTLEVGAVLRLLHLRRASRQRNRSQISRLVVEEGLVVEVMICFLMYGNEEMDSTVDHTNQARSVLYLPRTEGIERGTESALPDRLILDHLCLS